MVLKVWPWTSRELPESRLEMYILRPYPQPTDSMGVGPRNLDFNKLSR